MDFLPMPHHVRRLEGRFCIRYNGCIMLQDTEPSALLYARMLRDTIREETGLVLSIRRGQGEAIASMCCRRESLCPAAATRRCSTA